jgi:hypothetical protein
MDASIHGRETCNVIQFQKIQNGIKDIRIKMVERHGAVDFVAIFGFLLRLFSIFL